MLDSSFQLDRNACSVLFGDPETTGTTCLTILITAYPDVLDYEDPPDVLELWARVREDFSVTVHEDNENRINALLLALTTDGFYQDIEIFEAVCLGLGGDIGDLAEGVMEDPTMPEILWAAFEVGLWREDDPEFSSAVQSHLQRILEREREEINPEEFLAGFERYLVEQKTGLVRELLAIKAPQASIQRVVNFDATPLLDAAGNLVPPSAAPATP